MSADTAVRACTHKTLPDRRQQIQATSLGTADALSADTPGFLAEGTEDALSADAKGCLCPHTYAKRLPTGGARFRPHLDTTDVISGDAADVQCRVKGDGANVKGAGGQGDVKGYGVQSQM